MKFLGLVGMLPDDHVACAWGAFFFVLGMTLVMWSIQCSTPEGSSECVNSGVVAKDMQMAGLILLIISAILLFVPAGKGLKNMIMSTLSMLR
jgi:hypothetical protein